MLVHCMLRLWNGPRSVPSRIQLSMTCSFYVAVKYFVRLIVDTLGCPLLACLVFVLFPIKPCSPSCVEKEPIFCRLAEGVAIIIHDVAQLCVSCRLRRLLARPSGLQCALFQPFWSFVVLQTVPARIASLLAEIQAALDHRLRTPQRFAVE